MTVTERRSSVLCEWAAWCGKRSWRDAHASGPRAQGAGAVAEQTLVPIEIQVQLFGSGVQLGETPDEVGSLSCHPVSISFSPELSQNVPKLPQADEQSPLEVPWRQFGE